ncbi:MAG: Tol-Pal system beta propeller repeat protein TolB [Granulosicoccaceae bacterium]|jgi:TolB protein
MVRKVLTTGLLLMLFMVNAAHAALTIQITEGVEGALPIAVVPFAIEGNVVAPDHDLAEIIRNDLARSGRFAPMPVKDLIARPHQGSEVRFADWRLVGQDNLVIGRLRARADGRLEVLFQLFDVIKGQQLAGYSIPFVRNDVRRIAHRISDIIYEKLTGQKGAFTTRIAYITTASTADGKQSYRLNIADADAYNEQIILTSKQPLMSPSWSPDGQKLAYVSYEKGKPQIFIQEVFTGKREAVTDYTGLNNAPAWSPDGRALAMTLSHTGNPEIHVLDLASRRLVQVTRHVAIDTEPVWAPDGKSLVFTSDRGGKPQLYRVAMNGSRPAGDERRLSWEGNYNSRATFSPDGRQVAMVHGSQGNFRIAVLDLETGHLRVLTTSRLDESPTFAPNGSMVMYATEHAGRGILAAVSVDGRVHQRLEVKQGEVREPAWSPFTE